MKPTASTDPLLVPLEQDFRNANARIDELSEQLRVCAAECAQLRARVQTCEADALAERAAHVEELDDLRKQLMGGVRCVDCASLVDFDNGGAWRRDSTDPWRCGDCYGRWLTAATR